MRNGRRAGSVIEWVSSSFSLPACYLTPLMSFNRLAAAWSPPCCYYCCLDDDVITGRSPCVLPGLPPLTRFLFPVLSLPRDESLCSLPGIINTSYIGLKYRPGGHKNLLTVSLGVINTPEYNMELINRCYYLQWAVQAQDSNEGVCEVSVWGLMLMWGILLSLTNVVLRTVCKWAILFSSPNTDAMKRSIEEKDKRTSEKKIKRL